LTARLQALQHAHFWRQHRSLFTAVNALLEPVIQAVCSDIIPADICPSLSSELVQGVVSKGQYRAQARLHLALQMMLPRSTSEQVVAHALCELAPIVQVPFT
jgi:hypothetical protein